VTRQIVSGSFTEQSNQLKITTVGFQIALDMKEAARDNEYVRRGEALGGAAWGWILGIGTAALIGFLVIANYSVGDNNTASTANNSAPNATSNSPPRIPPSTTGSGAQPEQPAQTRPGG
jgi:hypothetical protein